MLCLPCSSCSDCRLYHSRLFCQTPSCWRADGWVQHWSTPRWSTHRTCLRRRGGGSLDDRQYLPDSRGYAPSRPPLGTVTPTAHAIKSRRLLQPWWRCWCVGCSWCIATQKLLSRPCVERRPPLAPLPSVKVLRLAPALSLAKSLASVVSVPFAPFICSFSFSSLLYLYVFALSF